jgi:beta-mannosidase
MVAAGANMIRVGGTMTYESEAFYRLCDELGIMVWQDFMFANMDYPVTDEEFLALVTAEAHQELRRLGAHPSVVTWCGGSEVEQQAAMFGTPRDIWTNEFFSEVLPGLVQELHPTAVYWPSTPTGGALPFQTREGLTHYYGVGAYLRPLDDVRVAGVRFTPETLGFSNVPEPEVVQSITPDGGVAPHHPDWKRGVPRDSGAGWDFEDVRDHYLSVLEGCDPLQLRYEDLERYWALSRTVPGRLMERVFREWRSEGALGTPACGGGLVWFLRDLVPGAGWGILDHTGAPKATYYYLRRAWAPRTVSLLDRGLDGFDVAVVNDTMSPLRGAVRLTVLDRGRVVTAEEAVPVEVAAVGSSVLSADRILGRFMDLTHAYRFGPPKHEAVAVDLLDEEGDVLATDVVRVHPERSVAAHVEAEVTRAGDGLLLVTVASQDLAYGVRISVRDHLPDDNYVTLLPGRKQVIELRANEAPRPFRGSLEALNAPMPVRLTLTEA